MPLQRTSSKSAETKSSRLFRTLRRKGTDFPAQGAPSSSKGTTTVPSKLERVGVGNSWENAPSSSNTIPATPGHITDSDSTRPGSEPELTELVENLATAIKTPSGDPPIPEGRSTFIAQKIQILINSLPAFTSRFLSSSSNPPVTIVDSGGCPIPPPGAVRIQDPELISLLSNADVMNGSDGRRQSVWSMLDAIRPPPVGSAETVDEYDDYAGSDRSSIMMYSPLLPAPGSVVELADLEEVLVVQGDSSSGGWFPTSWPVWPNLWPFNGWKQNVTEADAIASSQLTAILLTESQNQNNFVAERREIPVHRVWVPSTTKLSFETTWWGYRIYLPPPVLEILDDQSVEAAKQATTITAALTWFFSNLPVSAFPPPVRPAIILLQRLVPFVSYIGTFISWSWSTIRGFDRGHGVILTATWLLPIALIPGTWHARDVPPPSSSASVVPESVYNIQSSESPEVVVPQPIEPQSIEVPPVASSSTEDPPAKHRKSTTNGKSKNKPMSTLRKLKRTLT
ncbi:hypothetical protein C8R43DRAFT_877050 [Mycena crocata]|nr:hypothetical protein C8R43DRAFT_877050 [Mycena crocata]